MKKEEEGIGEDERRSVQMSISKEDAQCVCHVLSWDRSS